MQGMHIFRRDWTTQLIKCTPWCTKLHPHPTVIKKIKTFLEVEGKMGPIPVPLSQSGLQCQTPILALERTMPQRRGREQHLTSLDQQPPNLLQHVFPYHRPHQNPRMMHPYLHNNPVRAFHGLVQAKCQVTYSRTEIVCSCQITRTTPRRTKQKMNLKLQPMSQAQSLRSKKKLRQMNNP